MPKKSAASIVVGRDQRVVLMREVARRNARHWVVLRCRTILLLADGERPSVIARLLGTTTRFVRKWRSRWKERPEFVSLLDGDRPGRPPRIPLATKCHVVQLACSQPTSKQAPCRSIWTQQALAYAIARDRGEAISRSTVGRVLRAEGLRPHRVRYWLHSPDPDFTVKVERICDLYLNPPNDAIVLCIDEKPMQSLRRLYPAHVAAGGFVRREFEYERGGVCHLLGAFDTRTGRIVARVVRKRTEKAVTTFLESIARRFPDRKIVVIWDNLNIHCEGKNERWSRFNERHGYRFDFVYTPLHASWVNQIEIWFSILQRRILRNGSFKDLADLKEKVLAFVAYWNRYEARPFRWTFTGKFVQTPDRVAA